MLTKIPDLYYYTTVETMKYILQDGNIFATNIRYMNDAEEYSNGLLELQKILHETYPKTKNSLNEAAVTKLIEGHTEVYSISFSTERDLLSQWYMYARESGVSLKINFNRELKYLFYPYTPKVPGNIKREYTLKNIVPQKVYYLTEKTMQRKTYTTRKREIIEEINNKYKNTSILKDIEDENAMEVWQDMAPYVKRYEFKAEGEYRLVFSSYKLFEDEVRVDYRNDKNVLKPYLDVKCENGWPVEEIIVGPGFNQQVVFTGLKHYLQHKKLEVPFKDGALFQESCKNFLRMNKKLPGCIDKIWNEEKEKMKSSDVEMRYKSFENMLEEIINSSDADEKYTEYLQNRYLSKDGILLSKSEIPYIY